MASIGENIKSIRKKMKKTQNEFASIIGVSRSYLGDLENNRKSPSADTITKLSKSLGVSESYLFTGEDDYARDLLNELEKELKEDDSITDKVAASIINDIENRLFPEFFPRDYTDRDSLEKEFNDYKKSAIELWKNYKEIEIEIASRISRQISNDIYGNLEYFYVTTYNKDGEKGEKVSTRADEIVKRLEKLDRFQRAYIDVFRSLDDKKIVKELDKIDSYTEKLRNLNGTIDLTELDNI